jgi:hypothetical protein
MEGIQLVAPLALLLRADLTDTRQSGLEGRFKLGVAYDLAADIANDSSEPAASSRNCLRWRLNCLAWA